MLSLCLPRAESYAQDRPGTFAALMDLYERNYIQIRRLAPVLPAVHRRCISQVPGALDLHLRVLERCRYTSELILTYRFGREDGADTAEPELRIRVYHDARQAEVTAAHLRHPVTLASSGHSGPAANNLQLLSRWRSNRFLYKWLAYCLRQGHRFPERNIFD